MSLPLLFFFFSPAEWDVRFPFRASLALCCLNAVFIYFRLAHRLSSSFQSGCLACHVRCLLKLSTRNHRWWWNLEGSAMYDLRLYVTVSALKLTKNDTPQQNWFLKCERHCKWQGKNWQLCTYCSWSGVLKMTNAANDTHNTFSTNNGRSPLLSKISLPSSAGPSLCGVLQTVWFKDG